MSLATEALARDFIERAVEAGEPLTIDHGLGRAVAGWQVIWCDAPVNFYVYDASADTRNVLTLVPDATATVRLVIL